MAKILVDKYPRPFYISLMENTNMETKNIVCTAELKCGHSREIEFPREASIQEACEIVDMLRHINCAACEPEGSESVCA